MSETNQKTVSYSQFSLYAKCPRRWELDYLQNRRVYEQSIHTIFGTAFHTTLQNYLTVMYNESVKKADEIDLPKYLQEQIFSEYQTAIEKNGNKHFSNTKELSEFYLDGVEILKYVKRHRGVYFPSRNHKLVGIEKPLEVQLKGNIGFKGFIDIVILDERDNTIKIWDIKTSTAGWNKYQKADQTKTAQLILYKEFYAKQYNWEVEKIDVEYLIVRRKINEASEFVPKRVQLFSPASGRVTRNKIGKLFQDFLNNCFTDEGEYNTKGSFPAIETSVCKYCPYFNSELCVKKDRIKK
jgi:hypothetical protein